MESPLDRRSGLNPLHVFRGQVSFGFAEGNGRNNFDIFFV